MRSNAFDPSVIQVKQGEEVEFKFHNADKVKHEAFFGTAKEQDEHEEAMEAGSEHEMHGTKSVTVEPGKTESVTYTFSDEAMVIGCHEPGHFAAGMAISVPVT